MKNCCIFPSCKQCDVYARGVCWSHYKMLKATIKRGTRSEGELVYYGFLKPIRTKNRFYRKIGDKRKLLLVPPLVHKYAHLLDEDTNEGKNYKDYIKK